MNDKLLRIWGDVVVVYSIQLATEEKYKNCELQWPVIWPRFQPNIYSK